MPRTKLSAHADAQKDFKVLIKSRGYALYGSCAQAAQHVGISEPTMSRRLRNVDSFSLEELRRLRAALKIPKDDFLRALENLI